MPSLFFFFILLLLHFGCFACNSHMRSHHRRFKKKASKPTGLFPFLRAFFTNRHHPPPPHPENSISSPCSSTRSLRLHPTTLEFSSYNTAATINPCPDCGELFHTPDLLDRHRSTKHALSELIDGENIIRIIFHTGWPDKAPPPTIHRILKIHAGPKTVARFEEYRESVKSRASKASPRDSRCAADGNELLRFHCTTFLCKLEGACGHPFCNACGIIRSGFSHKVDGISTLPTSWRAHAAVPEDLEVEFGFMGIRRALLVCRVIAGRVGCGPDKEEDEEEFDSLDGQDGLVVFNPRAVLPCFAILYTV